MVTWFLCLPGNIGIANLLERAGLENYLSFMSVVARKMGKIAGFARLIFVSDTLPQPEVRAVALNEVALDEYVTQTPSAQNAIDVLPGWNMALPPSVGVVAGPGYFYNDARISWAIEQFGGVEGCQILELGPLEAAHTYMLEGHGAASIHAVEANKLAFLRCLVVKELLELKKARFFLGDCQKFLENTEETYDLIIASGILYHMPDPIKLLELIARHTQSFYLWTHYFMDEAMPPGDLRRTAFSGDVLVRESHGVKVRLYQRSYHGSWRSKSFCGGTHDLHHWIERDDLLALIRALGYEDIRIAHDEPGHQNGPAFSIFARRMPTEVAVQSGE